MVLILAFISDKLHRVTSLSTPFLFFQVLLRRSIMRHRHSKGPATSCWSLVQVPVSQTVNWTKTPLLHHHTLEYQHLIQPVGTLCLLLLWAPKNYLLLLSAPVLTAVSLPTLSRLRPTRNSVPCRNMSPSQCRPNPLR